jgi:tetratricopeptide (TPR) repeat protein
MPLQHPGARKPIVSNDDSHSNGAKTSAREKWSKWHSWTHLGVLLDAGAENTTDHTRDLPSYGLEAVFGDWDGQDVSSGGISEQLSKQLREARERRRLGQKKTNPGRRALHPEPALAVLFDRYGGVENAFEVFLRATRENPKDPVMWSDLGNAYRVKGESDLAVECFERALRVQPHPDFYLNFGGVRFVMGEPEEAIRLFTLGLQMNPRHPLLQYSIGNAYASQGRSEEAARSFEATLRIQPDFQAARQHLNKLKKEMRGRWLPSGGVAGACAVLLTICVGVQRAVSAFALGSAAVAEGRARNVERHGRAIGGAMNALGMRPQQTPAAQAAAAAAAAAARGLEHNGQSSGGKHRHGSRQKGHRGH